MADVYPPGMGPNDGMHFDPNEDPSKLRFSVGNLIMYKTSEGWFDGEIAKVSQRLTIGPHSQYIPYIVWPLWEDADGTDWVEHFVH